MSAEPASGITTRTDEKGSGGAASPRAATTSLDHTTPKTHQRDGSGGAEGVAAIGVVLGVVKSYVRNTYPNPHFSTWWTS